MLNPNLDHGSATTEHFEGRPSATHDRDRFPSVSKGGYRKLLRGRVSESRNWRRERDSFRQRGQLQRSEALRWSNNRASGP